MIDVLSAIFYDDLWVLDLKSETWTLLSGYSSAVNSVPTTDSQPGGRIYHTMYFDPASKNLYLFSGYNDDLCATDLWFFNWSINQWERVTNNFIPSSLSPDTVGCDTQGVIWNGTLYLIYRGKNESGSMSMPYCVIYG